MKLGKLLDIASLAIAACVCLATGLLLYDRVARPDMARVDIREVPAWERYAQTGRVIGPADAPIRIVEWGDYQCPACRSMEKHVRAVLRRFPNDVALVYRHWPLSSHQFAYPAARAAECAADQGRFEAFHRILFEDSNWLGDAFAQFARRAGVEDPDAFRECMLGTEPVPQIELDIEAAREVGAPGTPTFLIEGKLYGGPVDSLDLMKIIESRLAGRGRN